MGRDALIKHIDRLLYDADHSPFRYDEAGILYQGLVQLKILIDKECKSCYNKEQKKETVRENG